MSSLIRSWWTPIVRVFGRSPGVATIAESPAPDDAAVVDSDDENATATTGEADPEASAPPSPAAAIPESIIDFAAHLEFLGYTVEPTPDGWHYAQHPVRYNFSFRSTEAGLRMHCPITIGAALPGGRRAWLEWVNMANDRALLCRFALVEDDRGVQTLRVRHLFSRGYDRRAFGAAIDMWHEDLALLRYAPPPNEQDEEDAEEDTPATVIN